MGDSTWFIGIGLNINSAFNFKNQLNDGDGKSGSQP